MKLTSLYFTTHLASLAISAPTPLRQFGHLEAEPQSQAPRDEAVASGKGRWRLGYPKIFPEAPVLGGKKGSKDGYFNNIPWNPPNSAQLSKVLTAERPLTTEYLLSHRPKQSSEARIMKGEAARPAHQLHDAETVTRQHQLDMQAEFFEVSEMEIAIAIPSRMGTPCRYARLSRDRNDVLVVFLAVAFLLAVLMIEAWGSICRSARNVLGRPGAIRLEINDEGIAAGRQPLSIQSSEKVLSSEENENP